MPRIKQALIVNLSLTLVLWSAFATASSLNVDQQLIAPVLNNIDHPHHSRIHFNISQLIRVGPASGVILAPTSGGLGVVVTAAHVFGVSPDPRFEGTTPAKIGQYNSMPVISRRAKNSFIRHLTYSIYEPEFPVTFEEYALTRYATLEPAYDFTLGILTGETVQMGVVAPDKPSSTPMPMEKLEALSSSEVAIAKPGDSALALGFPVENQSEASYSIGRILTETESKQLLAGTDPEEGAIAFNGNVEFLVLAKGTSGMSGGPIFDSNNKVIGISVRGGVTADGTSQYIRGLRIEYLLKIAWNDLNQLKDTSEGERLTSYLTPLMRQLDPSLVPTSACEVAVSWNEFL